MTDGSDMTVCKQSVASLALIVIPGLTGNLLLVGNKFYFCGYEQS